jgi:hypothetical protein
MQLFARRDNAFKQVDLLKIDYAPAWAKLDPIFPALQLAVAHVRRRRQQNLNGVI